MHAVIIGASGGIGGAITAALAMREDVSTIHAFSRSGNALSHAKIHAGQLDLEDEASIAAAAKTVASIGAPDFVFVATGILSDGADLQPERTFKSQKREAFERVFSINTYGPALIA